MLPVLWLRWKQIQGIFNYWLRLVDYDTKDQDIMNRAFGLYLVLFMAWWTAGMWAIAAGFIAQIGSALPAAAAQDVLTVMPTLVFVGQAILIMLKLRSSPYKLSSPDIAYVGGSPVQRTVPVTIGFFGDLVLPSVLSVVSISFVAVALNQRLGSMGAVMVALRSALAVIPVVALTWAVAWLVGLARMVAPGARRRSALWLAPVLLLPLPFVVPGVVAWPGNVLASILVGESVDLSVVTPVVLVAVALIALVSVMGSRVNMIDVADESLIYARLREIGNLRWMAPSVYRRARSQFQAATHKPVLHLPEAEGLAMLVARSALTYIRNPIDLLKLLFAVALVQGGLAMLAYQLPALLIVVWLYAVAVAPTSSLTRVFSADADDPSLRQFLPMDSLRLLLADAALPMALVILVSAVLWLLQPVPVMTALLGLVLIGLLTLLLVLCRGSSLLPLTSMRAHVSYGVLAVIGLGLTLGAGLLLGGMLAAVVAGALVVVVLASLVAAA
ncbi:MAG: hypothetical protein M1546_03670 [Chloroflexi bacterium]|nr:hypothetical protein [Chloroflexota bacterium]